jgi:heme-degrading monooxygenase HmoA
MLQIVWEFHARPERLAEFEVHYGPQGSWAQLFRKGAGYQQTLMWRDTKDRNRFLVIDIWERAESFAAFKQQFKADYEALDKRCEELTVVESHIGNFEAQ